MFAVAGLAIALFFVVTVRISLWLLEVVTDLDRARHAQAALTVAEERLRFSRDVHDVLGRRLSAIAAQSELAATLAERGDDQARERMLEVRAVAHEALREARELARGHRATDLADELERARSLLQSAGIEVRLDVDGLPERWQEPAAWVLREAVTNVLRHSSATRVTIEYADGQLVVTDDGVVGAGSEGGSGLAGLRERLAPLGVELTAAPDGTTFAVVATLPGAGPDAEPR
ncbi:MAG: histidine kinase [Actinomycetota bacterium]|nr:histidine kinase [Actinomycetota bacterium]